MSLTWPQFCEKSQWVATVQTYNNDLTVYACLQQACKQFEHVLVVDDGSTDMTMQEVDRFIRREKPSSLHVFDLSRVDPWPELKAPRREGDETHLTKTISKSKKKTYDIAKQLCGNLIWVSIESDVVICDDARSRMVDRISKWSDPQTDVEFFNVVMTIDPWHVRSVSKSENEYIKPDGITQRREYDHPGDWTLHASWLGGKMSIVPDSAFPYHACYSPWLEKNQLQKKGQDVDLPYGFHMLSYRESCINESYEGRRYHKISSLDDKDVDWDLLHRVRFPSIMKLDETGKRVILSCEW
jgi:hypothetical protein